MVISRQLENTDIELLNKSLAEDEYHKDTTSANFFFDNRSVCNVYEDDLGPVLFVRGTKALRLDIQFVDNHDRERNLAVMFEGFPKLVELAKANGFTEIIFDSTSPGLIALCKRRFGFRSVNGELRKSI